jgi:phage-related baseplate assembly protein
MANPFSAIDLSKLPAPDVVESLSVESIVAEILADYIERHPEFSAFVESEPAYKFIEELAYREFLLRQRINDAARACMLAYAVGADLDNLAALYGVSRKLVTAGDDNAIPPVEPVYETDGDFRVRTQLALEGFSVAGPAGAYIFHGLSVDTVKDVAVTSPVPGDVLVSVLSTAGDGTPDQALLDAVFAALNDDDVRPLTDNLLVQAPTVKIYAIEATLTTLAGPDSNEVLAAAEASVTTLVQDSHKLGRDITFSALYAALHQGGVHKVTLEQPAAEIINSDHEAAYCSGIVLTHGGNDE